MDPTAQPKPPSPGQGDDLVPAPTSGIAPMQTEACTPDSNANNNTMFTPTAMAVNIVGGEFKSPRTLEDGAFKTPRTSDNNAFKTPRTLDDGAFKTPRSSTSPNSNKSKNSAGRTARFDDDPSTPPMSTKSVSFNAESPRFSGCRDKRAIRRREKTPFSPRNRSFLSGDPDQQ